MILSDPIAFARRTKTRGPCANFVAAWLRENGVNGLPTLREIIDDWRAHGAVKGTGLWCARIGLVTCGAKPFAVSLIAQKDGGEILGVLSSDCLFVTRAFGRVLVGRDFDCLACWRIGG